MNQNLAKRGLDRVSVPSVIAGMAGLLMVRVLLFPHSGVGALIVIILFWLLAFVLFLKLLIGLAFENRWDYAWLLLALFALIASAILGKRTVGPVTFILFLVGIVGFGIVWLRRARRRSAP